jgi:hypothetical protein
MSYKPSLREMIMTYSLVQSRAKEWLQSLEMALLFNPLTSSCEQGNERSNSLKGSVCCGVELADVPDF